MPFTFSHPAIILPLSYLHKKWYSLTGLVIGSMAPDFEYFLRMKVESKFSHTLSGLFWLDLPLGLLLAFLFHNIVRNSLLDNLPGGLRSRFTACRHFNWNRYFKKNWLVVLVSILIGAGSHLFWDSFTHVHGYFVRVIPALTHHIHLFGLEVPVFKVIQHASTMAGGLTIILAVYLLPTTHKAGREAADSKYWISFLALTLTIVAVRMMTGLGLKQYGDIIVTAIAAGMIALILTPIMIRPKHATPQ